MQNAKCKMQNAKCKMQNATKTTTGMGALPGNGTWDGKNGTLPWRAVLARRTHRGATLNECFITYLAGIEPDTACFPTHVLNHSATLTHHTLILKAYLFATLWTDS